MKENIFDVLIYLFENYLDDDIDLLPDSEGIKAELLQAGFEPAEVNSAFDWLEALTEQSNIKPNITSAFRIFCRQEEVKLDIECRNFLLFLEHTGILTATTREIVIDRAMAIENEKLTLEELKWTVLMVLLSQSDDDVAFSRMEDIVYDLTPALLH
jgi:Smg protein